MTVKDLAWEVYGICLLPVGFVMVTLRHTFKYLYQVRNQ